MSYADTRTLGVEEIRAFFEVVDRHLTATTSLVIIGGAAAAFHRAESTTNDVDTVDAPGSALVTAIEQAIAETGLFVPVSRSSVAQMPWNYEDRLERQLPELKYLEVWILEKHDLTLSKIVRGVEHDLQQLEEIHRNSGLDFEILVERFRTEMASVVGDPIRIRQNFLALVERLFGELKRVSAEQRLK
jgi:hypothetical protein